MKSLVRRENTWHPFKEMEEMQNRLTSLPIFDSSRSLDPDNQELTPTPKGLGTTFPGFWFFSCFLA